jgi:endo-1,4-beta-xylanase
MKKQVLIFSLFGFILWGCTQNEVLLEPEAIGLRAVYFNNENFTGTQVTRIDTTLNFDWGEGSPVAGIAPDTFSVRWTGSISPRYSELYTFITNADDGLRLWVNGVKIIDDWTYSPHTRYAKLRLQANVAYAIKIEYHEGVVGAGIKLQWQSRSQVREVVSALSTSTGQATGLPATATLRDLAYARGIVIGGALEPTPLANDALYRETAQREFNYMSPDGSFSIIDTHDTDSPHEMLETIPKLDAQVNFAFQNGAQSQAFHLAWFRDSLWTTYLNEIPENQRWSFLEQHIRNIIGRYKNKTRYYNVVNEAFDEYGNIRPEKIDENLVTGEYAGINWLYPLGSTYIEDSFRVAHEAGPNVRLVYNDYAIEGNDENSNTNAKWEAILAIVKDFKARGVPIHVVGFQGHHTMRYGLPDPAILAERFRILHQLGIEVRITEFDLNIADTGDTLQERLAQQAAYYKAVLNVCLAAPNCTGFQTWGFTDKYTWYNDPNNPEADPEARPLIFDRSYRKKPTYYALRDALRGR